MEKCFCEIQWILTYWLNFLYVAGELDEPGNHDTKVGNDKPDQGEPPTRPLL